MHLGNSLCNVDVHIQHQCDKVQAFPCWIDALFIFFWYFEFNHTEIEKFQLSFSVKSWSFKIKSQWKRSYLNYRLLIGPFLLRTLFVVLDMDTRAGKVHVDYRLFVVKLWREIQNQNKSNFTIFLDFPRSLPEGVFTKYLAFFVKIQQYNIFLGFCFHSAIWRDFLELFRFSKILQA